MTDAETIARLHVELRDARDVSRAKSQRIEWLDAEVERLRVAARPDLALDLILAQRERDHWRGVADQRGEYLARLLSATAQPFSRAHSAKSGEDGGDRPTSEKAASWRNSGSQVGYLATQLSDMRDWPATDDEDQP